MTHRLKTLLPLALLVGGAASLHGQLAGTVSDANTRTPLRDATVLDSIGGTSALTGRAGEFSIPCSAATTLIVRKVGYQTIHFPVARCVGPVRIELAQGARMLTAVNVTGDAEASGVDQSRSTTTIGVQQLRRSTGLFLQDELNLTPGIYMQRRSMSGGQTIRIRGYSNGGDAGNFTGTGYKAFINGIPITDAEGQTVLDDIDFANLGRVDVIRGPASSLYGAGIGGVVNFYTALPTERGTTATQRLLSGSDGLLRSDTRVARASDASTIMLAFGHQGYDSYRVHSESKKDYGTFVGEFRPSAQQSVSTYLGYANSRDQRAGELDSASFARELNAGEAKYINNNARSNIESFRAGVTQQYRYNDRVASVITGYFTGNTLEDVYAAGINSKSNQTFGVRALLNTTFDNGSFPLRGTTGVDFEKTNVSAQGYALSNAVLGGMRSDLDTHNMQSSLFSQWDLSLPREVAVTAGASVNFIEYEIEDRMANTANPTHKDGSGRQTYTPVVTPTLGIRKMITPRTSLYANVSRGYTPATSSDAVISFTGEPNTGLKPERATQYEIGSRGSVGNDRLSYQISLFDTRVTNKLSPQGVFDTDGSVLYTYTVNAGDQNDRGVEVAANYALIDKPGQFLSFVSPFVSYTFSDFTYRNFKSDNNDNTATVDYTDKKVVGVARNVVNFGLDARTRVGVYGNATYHRTDGMPISYDNAHSAPGFSLVSAKVGFAHDFMDRYRLDAFVGGDNLSNSRYYTQVFLNHKWNSPTPPNMYLPGPYRATFYGGLGLTIRP